MFQGSRFTLWILLSKWLVGGEFPVVSIFAPGDPEDEDRNVKAIIFAVDENAVQLARMRRPCT